MAITVGELSRLTGITVRALHHYDEIGLVRPSARTAAGYRLYSDDDVLRLQQVLVLRELGLALDEIGAALEGDRASLLRRHRAALVAKRGQLDAMLAAVDAALAVMEERRVMSDDEVKKLFDGFEAEAKERWGHTKEYAESQRRTKGYGKAEWDEIKREADAIYAKLAALMGTPVTDPAVQAAVAEHRAHISRWFYACSAEIHRGLGEMYIADPRFTQNLDKIAPGFAQFLRDAIAASDA